jgi:iduronate 2-sulfatase
MVFRTIILCLCISGSAIVDLCAAEQQKKNVLMIVSDDLNTDLGCYGHPLVKSPHIDRLAQRGVRFERAYCQYPLCNPSRSSFMTSLYPDQTGVLSNADDFRMKQPNVVTLGQLFQKAGYFVARVGKIYHYGVPNQIGTDGADDRHSWQLVVNPRGIDRESHDKIHSLVPSEFGGTLSWLNVPSKDEEHTDGVGATEAIRLLEEHQPAKTGRPFFLAVGFYRPHTPYVAPSHHFDKYSLDAIHPVMQRPGDRDDIPPPALFDKPKQRELTVDQRKEIIQAYYASISLMDAQVGRVLDALDRLKLADNTIVLFFSDHGYQLGEHDLWQKSTLFERSVRVPLIIANPEGKNAGQASASLTEMVDIYPTIAELASVDKPSHVMGQSLVPVLNDTKQSLHEEAFSVTVSRSQSLGKRGSAAKGYSIRTPRYRYTMWDEGESGEELYDYEKDPEEFTNLARDPAQRELLEKMKALMQKKLERSTK